jgi:hypothetical protein
MRKYLSEGRIPGAPLMGLQHRIRNGDLEASVICGAAPVSLRTVGDAGRLHRQRRRPELRQSSHAAHPDGPRCDYLASLLGRTTPGSSRLAPWKGRIQPGYSDECIHLFELRQIMRTELYFDRG